MTNNTAYSQSDVESRVGQARLEEGLKHLGETMSEGFKRLEEKISNRDVKYEDLEHRLALQEKRLDKVYWFWGAAVFLGTPIMVALSKFALAKFGL